MNPILTSIGIRPQTPEDEAVEFIDKEGRRVTAVTDFDGGITLIVEDSGKGKASGGVRTAHIPRATLRRLGFRRGLWRRRA